MRQVYQTLKTGQITVTEVPESSPRPGDLLVRTRRSLLSTGTERMLLDFGRASWLEKARQQPDKVWQAVDRVRTDGLVATVNAVRTKLDRPMPMGYSNAGVVIEVGSDVTGFRPGDRVVSNGPHSEFVRVPKNLCARIPEPVSDDQAAFAVLGAVALQGIRLARPTVGECFVVTGLGLIGLFTVQILRANGCRVLGIDVDRRRLELAHRFGAEILDLSQGQDPLAAAESFSRGRGVDGVLLTLAETSSGPVNQAANMCRRRGRVILVGVTGLELARASFYEKEISFQVSCSYGPGRYDPGYEVEGRDYPVGFVRWTSQRNFEAVLDMMASGTVEPQSLVSHRFAFEQARLAYDMLVSGEPSLGILFEYPDRNDGNRAATQRSVRIADTPRTSSPSSPVVSFIGAGNYASRVLIPAFRDAGARLRSVATDGGISAAYAGQKYGFQEATTDSGRIFQDDEANVIVVATRHASHPRFAVQAIEAGKHVFVEKPLAITLDGIDEVEAAYRTADIAGRSRLLMVGFNRRFAPHVMSVKNLLQTVPESKTFIMTVNAGAISREHWMQDIRQSGRRIVGEACHFIDLLRHLAGSPVEGWAITCLRRNEVPVDDVCTFTLRFADGSHGTVHYLANGQRAFPKERLEVFAGGRVLQLDNFKRLRGWGWGRKSVVTRWSFRKNKGNAICASSFVDAVRRGRPAPIPFDELLEVSRVAVALAEEARAQ